MRCQAQRRGPGRSPIPRPRASRAGGAVERAAMPTSQRLAYLGCSFGIGVFSAFNNFTLTLWLAGFTTSYLLLGLMGNTRSFEGALIAPVAGALSDRTWLGW